MILRLYAERTQHHVFLSFPQLNCWTLLKGSLVHSWEVDRYSRFYRLIRYLNELRRYF